MIKTTQNVIIDGNKWANKRASDERKKKGSQSNREQNKYEEKSFKITFQLIEVWLVDYIGNYLKNIGKLN